MNRVCPKCGKEYSERPAISRDSRYKDICTLCGIKEAISYLPEDKQKEILETVEKVGGHNV